MRMFLIPAVALVLSACHLDVTSTSHNGLDGVDAATHCHCGSGVLDGGSFQADGGNSYGLDGGSSAGNLLPDGGFSNDGGSEGDGCNCGGEPDGGVDFPGDGGGAPDGGVDFPIDGGSAAP